MEDGHSYCAFGAPRRPLPYQPQHAFANGQVEAIEDLWFDGQYTLQGMVEVLQQRTNFPDTLHWKDIRWVGENQCWENHRLIRGRWYNKTRGRERARKLKRAKRIESASSTSTLRRCEENELHIYWDELENRLPCPHCLSQSQ